MTRILFANHSSKPGGAESVLRNIAACFIDESAIWLFEDGPFRTALEHQGNKVILAKPVKDMSGIKRDKNLLKTALPLAGSMASMVSQIIRASKGYDVIYANSQKAFVLSAFAAAITRKKLIWHCHDILSRDHFSNTQIKLGIGLANINADAVVVPSAATGKAFVESGGKQKLVNVVHNGIDSNDQKLDIKKEDLRKRLGLPNGFLFGVFSRLAQWKGQHIAIMALAKLPNASCIIVGDAQFGEDAYRESLEQLAGSLGVADRVQFLGHRDDVAQLMHAVDAYVHPSTSPEPFSIAILEAMRSSLPIIASNSGGVPEAIEHEKSGILFNPGDHLALAAVLDRIQNNKEFGAKLGVAARARVVDDFSIPIMQDKIRKIIQNI